MMNRHALREAMATLPPGWLEANPDAPGDVGAAISTPTEGVRQSTAEVVIAAGKRLSEALRALEEYGKTIGSDFAPRIESLRYRGYEIEHRVQMRLGYADPAEPGSAAGRAPQWRLCVLVTEAFCKRPWLEVLDAAIEGGADCIQLREKDLEDGQLLGRANVVAQRCREVNIDSMINDRPDIAALVDASGVHVGQRDLPPGHIRRLVGRTLIIGASTTNLVQAEAAIRSGADSIALGPMFATTTKAKPNLAGPEYAAAYLQRFDHPHLAIGGIDESNIEQLIEAGVRGVAVCAAVCGADDPRAAVERLTQALRGNNAPRG